MGRRDDDEEYAAVLAAAAERARSTARCGRLRDGTPADPRALPRHPRRVSGYNLDTLLPENGFTSPGLLVGTEATLVTVLRAELSWSRCVPGAVPGRARLPRHRRRRRRGAPGSCAHEPIALEGMDHDLIRDQQVSGINPTRLEELPDGRRRGCSCSSAATTRARPTRRAQRAPRRRWARPSTTPTSRFHRRPGHEDELWEVRESGLGATAHVPGQARHLARAGRTPRSPRNGSATTCGTCGASTTSSATTEAPRLYGHFGQGCVHTRIPFDLTRRGRARATARSSSAPRTWSSRYGGSLSGEHGDGQSRGELLPQMFGDDIVARLRAVKAIFDPDGRMNPGKVVAPYPLDDHLRLGADYDPARPRSRYFAYPDDGGRFGQPRGAASASATAASCRRARR